MADVECDTSSKFRSPAVEHCRSYYNLDFNRNVFEFPHDQLKTPPLDKFIRAQWRLPNDFVKNFVGNNTSVGNLTDSTHPYVLFDWYDTAGNFSNLGAPSLGAVIIYSTHASFGKTDNPTHYTNLATCSFGGRWVPVELFLDPKDDPTIRQDTPNPMDILTGPNKPDSKDFTQMKMHLEWAHFLNLKAASRYDPAASTVEQLLEALGGPNFANWWDIYPEPERDAPWVMVSIDWRISIALGLFLTEGLARAYVDEGKSSVVYRDAALPQYSYARSLNDLLNRIWVEGWDNHTLE
ncbi:MAG: hypothetical protein Q9190_001327 [Brigantiaea leucoxantha]